MDLDAELQDRTNRWQRTIEARDAEAAAEFLADDYALVILQPQPAVVQREEWLRMLPDYDVRGYSVEERISAPYSSGSIRPRWSRASSEAASSSSSTSGCARTATGRSGAATPPRSRRDRHRARNPTRLLHAPHRAHWGCEHSRRGAPARFPRRPVALRGPALRLGRQEGRRPRSRSAAPARHTTVDASRPLSLTYDGSTDA